MPFLPGVSGNPKGRPPKARPERHAVVVALFAAKAQEVAEKTLAMALAGDPACLRLVLERISPVPRGRRIKFALPQVSSSDDVREAFNCVLAAAGNGEITLDEANSLANTIAAGWGAIELGEFSARLEALEARVG